MWVVKVEVMTTQACRCHVAEGELTLGPTAEAVGIRSLIVIPENYIGQHHLAKYVAAQQPKHGRRDTEGVGRVQRVGYKPDRQRLIFIIRNMDSVPGHWVFHRPHKCAGPIIYRTNHCTLLTIAGIRYQVPDRSALR